MTETEARPSLVVEHLRNTEVACPTCLYNLRGIGDDRCPECGTALKLEVVGAGAAAAFWWLAAVMGCAIGTVLLLVTLLQQLRVVHALLNDPRIPLLVNAGAMSPTELPQWPTLVAVTAMLSALAMTLAWLLASRRRYGRLSGFARVTIGVTGGLAPLLVLGVLRLVILWV